MRFRQAILFVIMSLAVVCMMAGCVKTDMSVLINDKGGTVSLSVYIDEEYYSMLINMGGNIPALEYLQMAGYIQRGGVSYIKFGMERSFESHEDIVSLLQEFELDVGLDNFSIDLISGHSEGIDTSESVLEGFSTLIRENVSQSTTNDSNASKKLFRSVEIHRDETSDEVIYEARFILNPQESSANMKDADVSINDIIKVRLEIALPVDVEHSNGGIVSGNRMVVDIADLTSDLEIYATGVFVKGKGTLVDNTPPANEFYLPDSDSDSNTKSVTSTSSSVYWLIMAGIQSIIFVFCVVAIVKILRVRRLNRSNL